jgi:predicted ferric reductase
MKFRKMLGWLAIILISILPAFLLLHYGPASNLQGYQLWTQKIGQIAGLMGITLFALTFILSTRIRFIEDIFGGLDKVYIVHSILGGVALILILFHPILLVLKYVPANFYQAAVYLSPGSYWAVNFGIIAILGLIGLLYVTFYTKIKYNTWKISHKFLGLVFLVAVLHIFLVRGSVSRDSIFPGYYTFTSIVAIVGLAAFSYSLFIKSRVVQEAIYYVESIRHHKQEGAYEMIFRPRDKPLQYKSGQFIFVRFYNEELSREEHPFSIASKSDNPKIKIIVKSLGDFTSSLYKLKEGDKVSIEGPYGRFNFEEKNSDQVWVAGGIGITPFLSMAGDINESKRKIDLYYSVKKENELIVLDELKAIEKLKKNFRVIPWNSSERGHINAEAIQKTSGNLKEKEFFICGPFSLQFSLKRELARAGISQDRIHAEEFNFK